MCVGFVVVMYEYYYDYVYFFDGMVWYVDGEVCIDCFGEYYDWLVWEMCELVRMGYVG